jgi:hypothetical protein
LVSKKREIYTDYDGYHRHDVKPDSYLSAHFSWNRHFGSPSSDNLGRPGRGVKPQNSAALAWEISS